MMEKITLENIVMILKTQQDKCLQTLFVNGFNMRPSLKHCWGVPLAYVSVKYLIKTGAIQ